jgi:hypothetical protein
VDSGIDSTAQEIASPRGRLSPRGKLRPLDQITSPKSPKGKLRPFDKAETPKLDVEEDISLEEGLRNVIGEVQSWGNRLVLLETSQAQLARDLCLTTERVDTFGGRLVDQMAAASLAEQLAQDCRSFCQAEIEKQSRRIDEVQHIIPGDGSDAALRVLDERLSAVCSRLEESTPVLTRPMEPIREDETCQKVKMLREEVFAAMADVTARCVETDRKCDSLESTVLRLWPSEEEAGEASFPSLAADVQALSAQITEQLQMSGRFQDLEIKLEKHSDKLEKHAEQSVRIDDLDARLRGSLAQLAAEFGSLRVALHATLAEMEQKVRKNVEEAVSKDFEEAVERKTADLRQGLAKACAINAFANGSTSTKAPSGDEEDEIPVSRLGSTGMASYRTSSPQNARGPPYSPKMSFSNLAKVQDLRESLSTRSLMPVSPRSEVRRDPPIVSSARSPNQRHTISHPGLVPSSPYPNLPQRTHSPYQTGRSVGVQPQMFQQMCMVRPSSPSTVSRT